MPRAVVKNGVIVPIDPLPSEWADGRELWVEEADHLSRSQNNDLSRQPVEDFDPEDDDRLRDAIARIRTEAKVMACRQMGLD